MAERLEITVQETPNPQAVKFTLNRAVASRGVTYRDAAGAGEPWAAALLRIAGVTQVFALHDFIAVTKAPDAAWDAIVPQVERTLQQAFA